MERALLSVSVSHAFGREEAVRRLRSAGQALGISLPSGEVSSDRQKTVIEDEDGLATIETDSGVISIAMRSNYVITDDSVTCHVSLVGDVSSQPFQEALLANQDLASEMKRFLDRAMGKIHSR